MIRSTRQRKAILAVLQAEARPLTVNEIFQLALREAPGIGLRTVYRNIREMVDLVRVVGVDYPGQPPRYELVVGDRNQRPHFICCVCNKVFKLEPGREDQPSTRVIPGFIVEGTETIYYGRCTDEENCPHRKA
ncbi:MAG: transcriptional repressor [Opitutales bacterium]|jgi:Fur family ferric uptake transcriptional regulator